MAPPAAYPAAVPSRLLAVAFDAHDPARVADFWAAMLGRERVENAGGVLLPGDDTQVGLRFVASRSVKVGPKGMHLHLTSDSPAHQQETVATALARGASHLDVGQAPDEEHIVLADPEGNEFCVIEAIQRCRFWLPTSLRPNRNTSPASANTSTRRVMSITVTKSSS